MLLENKSIITTIVNKWNRPSVKERVCFFFSFFGAGEWKIDVNVRMSSRSHINFPKFFLSVQHNNSSQFNHLKALLAYSLENFPLRTIFSV